MTKTTTGSSRLTVILSWMIALICFAGGAFYIWMMPSPDQEAMDLQMKQQKNQKSRKSLTEKVKQEQAQRALPSN
ncbi:OmpH family outer membrane protein, partial [Bacteroides ovatus]